MANKYRGEAKLKIGGRERVLKYDMEAALEFEDVAGFPILGLVSPDHEGDKLKTKTVRALLWAGLLKDEPTLTLAQVNALMMEVDGDSLLAKLGLIFMAACEALGLINPEAKKKLMAVLDLEQELSDGTGEGSSE